MSAEHRWQSGMAQLAAMAAAGQLAAPKAAIVDDYDPDTYSARVRLQPSNTLTGFMSILSPWSGNGYGIACAPKPGGQVMVVHLDGDDQTGVVVGGFYSDADRPPQTNGKGPPAGDVWMVGPSGSHVRLTEAGKMALNGAGVMQGSIQASGVLSSEGAPTGVMTTTTGDVVHFQNGVVTVCGLSGLVNAAFFLAQAERMAVAEGCAELNALISEAFQTVADTENAITAQLAALAPYLALLHPPSDLPSLLAYINKFIAVFIGPQAAAYALMIEQQAALVIQTALLAEKAAEAALRFPTCEIAIPTLPGIIIPTP